MKKFNMSAFLGGLFLIATLAVTGCLSTSKLEPGGPYAPTTNIVTETGQTNEVALWAPDMGLFVSDQFFKTSYDTLTFVFELERNNRALFWSISPEVKHTLDKIRPKAVEIKKTWASARKSYTDHPTPAGLSQINTILAQLQQLAVAAQTALPTDYSRK